MNHSFSRNPIIRRLHSQHLLFCEELRELKEHVLDVETGLAKRQKQLEERFAEELKRTSSVEDSDLGDVYSEEFYKIEQLSPAIHRRSYLLTLFSVFEDHMTHLCQCARGVRSLELRVIDLKGMGIQRARTYLKKVAGVDLPVSQAWEKIKMAQDIRNLVTHNGSRLKAGDKSSEKIRKYAEKTKSVLLDDDQITLNDAFLPDVLEHMRQFSQDVIAAMKKTFANNG